MNFRIKEICKSKGMMMKDLADKLGITEVGLSKSLNGNPTIGRLEEIANVLGVEFLDLFKEDEKNSITCPNCGKKFVMEDSHIREHANIRGKEYYK